MMEDLKIRAEKIHDVLYKIASEKSIMIGRSSPRAIPRAIEKIKEYGFKKPFFTNPELWIKNLIVKNREAFVRLSPHIQLEFIVDGKLQNWRGNGLYLDFRKSWDLFINEDSEINQKFPPLWLQIKCDLNYEMFSKFLDEIPSQKRC